MNEYYSPYVHYLLIPYSEKRVWMVYGDDFLQLNVPLIGPRPPFYTNPIYEPYLPVI